MAKKTSAKAPAPLVARKQRTREHIIADQGVNVVERFILDNGYTGERTRSDYGFDVVLTTFDEQGCVEEGYIRLQVKATDHIAEYELTRNKDVFAFTIDIKDFHLWTNEPVPVFFILYDAVRRRAYWLYVQAYFATHPLRKADVQAVTLHIPKKNVLGKRTIKWMREKKADVLRQMQGVIQYHD
jgi:hypothetical protein